jgi:hypothetical protein
VSSESLTKVRERARFLRRWEIFSRSRTSASAGRRIKLPFGSNRILLGSQIGRPRSLAKISNAFQKSSLFLWNVRGTHFLAKIPEVLRKLTPQCHPELVSGSRSNGYWVIGNLKFGI